MSSADRNPRPQAPPGNGPAGSEEPPAGSRPAGSGELPTRPGPLEADPFYGVPSAAELIGAVAGFLETDLAPELSGRKRFHLRVALNVLAIVRRQLELAKGHASRQQAALRSLGVSSEQELAEAIRNGVLQDGTELRRALRALVEARLEVNNPTYLETYR